MGSQHPCKECAIILLKVSSADLTLSDYIACTISHDFALVNIIKDRDITIDLQFVCIMYFTSGNTDSIFSLSLFLSLSLSHTHTHTHTHTHRKQHADHYEGAGSSGYLQRSGAPQPVQ